MPKISVVMPAYNAEKYIGEAIESILNQTFKDFEFIIINDGSVDHTKEIIREYNDPRIVLLENDKNRGIVLSLNKGLDAATGKYIARMDADDIATKDRLEKQLEFLQVKSYDMVGCNAIKIDENGKEIGYLNFPTAHEIIPCASPDMQPGTNVYLVGKTSTR